MLLLLLLLNITQITLDSGVISHKIYSYSMRKFSLSPDQVRVIGPKTISYNVSNSKLKCRLSQKTKVLYMITSPPIPSIIAKFINHFFHFHLHSYFISRICFCYIGINLGFNSIVSSNAFHLFNFPAYFFYLFKVFLLVLTAILLIFSQFLLIFNLKL